MRRQISSMMPLALSFLCDMWNVALFAWWKLENINNFQLVDFFLQKVWNLKKKKSTNKCDENTICELTGQAYSEIGRLVDKRTQESTHRLCLPEIYSKKHWLYNRMSDNYLNLLHYISATYENCLHLMYGKSQPSDLCNPVRKILNCTLYEQFLLKVK